MIRDVDPFAEPEPANDASEPNPKSNGRADPPVIRLGCNIEENADAAIAALAAAGDIYQRDSSLVHVTRVSRDEETLATVKVNGITYRPIIEGTPKIHPLASPTLRERLSTLARWERFDARKREHVHTLPSAPVVSAVHARKQWTGIRRLVAVAEAPFMRPDGAIVQVPGYDALTGFVYIPSVDYPLIPDHPTQEDSSKALALLRDVFCDFPFVDPAQAIVPIAAILTILLRPAITGACPAFVVDASARGSGKTLLTDVIATIATGRDASRVSFPTRSFRTKLGVSQEIVNEEELEKILGACALSGARLVCFDNIVCEFGGAPLDKYITARDTVQPRILGVSDVPVLPWRGVILGCGNNFALAPDTLRRVLQCRLEPDMANPESRSGFRHDNGPVRGAAALMDFVRENRPALVAACLTIARAYVVAGRPETLQLGSFEEWSALVPSALRFADSSVNALDARRIDEAEVNESTAALLAILTLMPSAEVAHVAAQGTLGGMTRKRGLLAGELLSVLYPTGKRPDSADRPDSDRSLDPLRDAVEELTATRSGETPNPKAVGRALKRHLGRVLPCTLPTGETVNRRLASESDRATKNARWRVETKVEVGWVDAR